VEQILETIRHQTDSEICLDVGVTCFAALSDGTMVQGVHSFRRHEMLQVIPFLQGREDR